MGVSLSLTARDIVKLFEQDHEACKKFAELLVSDSEIRTTIINAVVREAATKHDLEELKKDLKGEIERSREETKQDIERLREEFHRFRQEVKQDIERVREETKREIEKFREETKRDIERLNERVTKLEERVSKLEERVARVEGKLDLFVKLLIALNVPLLTAIIGILLKMVLMS